jgi:hypothetical protein
MLGTPLAQAAFADLSPAAQATFKLMYGRQSRSGGFDLLWWLLFPIVPLVSMRRWGALVAFALTLGGFGIWWIVEVCLAPRRAREWNENLELTLLQQVKGLG